MQLSADGRYLLAADAGSNQISVLRIKPDGRLTEAEGSPVWSGGNEPVSIAVHDNLVYVANAGDGASNYTGFTLNAGGHLRPLERLDVLAARWLVAGGCPVQRGRNPAGRHARRLLADRQLHRRIVGSAHGSSGLPVRRPGPGPVRE